MVRTWQKKKKKGSNFLHGNVVACILEGFPKSFKGLGEINRGLSIFRYSTLHMFLM
jgi:hypothetical protein